MPMLPPVCAHLRDRLLEEMRVDIAASYSTRTSVVDRSTNYDDDEASPMTTIRTDDFVVIFMELLFLYASEMHPHVVGCLDRIGGNARAAAVGGGWVGREEGRGGLRRWTPWSKF